MLFSRLIPAKMRIRHECNRKLKSAQWTDIAQKNAKEKGRFSGKRCFIIGNGPSIKKEDLSLLKDEIVFTVNDMYLYDQFPQLNTNYHLLFDPLYFNDIADVIQRVNNKCVSPPTIVTSPDGQKRMQAFALPNDVLCLQSGFDIDYLGYIGLHIDGLLPYYCTVIQYALSLAIEMGFREIYLLGCDCTGIENYIDRKKGVIARSYCFELNEEAENKLATGSVAMTSEHAFYEWYHIFKSYRILGEHAAKRAIKIIDLTSDGILDTYPKGKLEDIVQVE